MRPYFHLLLLFSLFQLTGCGEEEVVQLPDDPTFEETTDPADVFTVECANHAPELYLSVTDKEATPILHMASDGQPEVGKIGIRGVHYAESDAVILMDSDLQHPPELIPEMVRWWRQGYDDVCAKRADRKDEGFVKRHLTNFFYKLLQKCSRTEIQRNVGDFRLLDRRCVAALRLMREGERYTKGMFTWVGFKKKELPFHVRPRAAGKTTWNYWSLLNLALEGLTSFTTAPLRLASMFGVAVSFLAILYMIYVFVRAMLYGDPVAGYPTLLTVMLCLGGVQLLALGIIGEYLGRVFNESKRRPLYLVDEMNGRKMTYVMKPVPVERRVKEKDDDDDD